MTQPGIEPWSPGLSLAAGFFNNLSIDILVQFAYGVSLRAVIK